MTTSQDPPARTRSTSLTDAELLILDALFDGGRPLRFLAADRYALHLNCPWTHTLSDEALTRTVEDLRRRELIDIRDDADPALWLTATGGVAWEAEREPVWDAFVTDSVGVRDDGTEELEILCTDEVVGREFAAAVAAYGVYRFDPADLRIDSRPEDALIYWRTFPDVRRLATPLEPDTEEDNASQGPWWNAYEQARTWWRDIVELSSLRG